MHKRHVWGVAFFITTEPVGPGFGFSLASTKAPWLARRGLPHACSAGRRQPGQGQGNPAREAIRGLAVPW